MRHTPCHALTNLKVCAACFTCFTSTKVLVLLVQKVQLLTQNMRRLYYRELSLALERDNAVVVMREEDPRCFYWLYWFYYSRKA